MNENLSQNAYCRQPDSGCDAELSIALVSPNEFRRAAAVESIAVICDFASYLSNPADLARLSSLKYDVIMVDVDGDTDAALKLVENLSSDDETAVLVYSSQINPDLLARCMRAGARDFLACPFEQSAVTEAFSRLVASRAAAPPSRGLVSRKISGKQALGWLQIFGSDPMVRSQARS
jgi:pilus assembly protein CpaE